MSEHPFLSEKKILHHRDSRYHLLEYPLFQKFIKSHKFPGSFKTPQRYRIIKIGHGNQFFDTFPLYRKYSLILFNNKLIFGDSYIIVVSVGANSTAGVSCNIFQAASKRGLIPSPVNVQIGKIDSLLLLFSGGVPAIYCFLQSNQFY